MFEFTEQEFNSICKKAMLNEELTKIFEMKIKGYSITKISLALKLAKGWLDDKDAKEDKLYCYWKHIIK